MSVDENAYSLLMRDPRWSGNINAISNLPSAPVAMPAIVGGAVRDAVLGRSIRDIDIATGSPGTAGKLARQFAESTGSHYVEYSHHQTIYRVVAKDEPQFDFTDPVGGDRESDLKRRDFTINSMALEIIGTGKGILIDPCGGMGDLQKKIVRINNPDVLDNDPLRMLRAFRFSGELGFSIDPGTIDEIKKRVPLLRNVSGERIQLELLLALEPENAAGRILELADSGILFTLIPELSMQVDVGQNSYHHLDVWRHTLEVVRIFEKVLSLEDDLLQPYRDRLDEYINFKYQSGHSRRSLMLLGALTHDIAKPHTKETREDGRITFIGHERLGAEFMKEILDRLRFPHYEIDFIKDMIQGHLRPGMITHEKKSRPKIAYRFFRDFEDAAVAIILLSIADRSAAQGEMVTEEINRRHLESVSFLLECYYDKTDIVVRPPTLIDGTVLIEKLNLEPGPIIGNLLNRVAEAQVMGEISTPDEALAFCRAITLSEL